MQWSGHYTCTLRACSGCPRRWSCLRRSACCRWRRSRRTTCCVPRDLRLGHSRRACLTRRSHSIAISVDRWLRRCDALPPHLPWADRGRDSRKTGNSFRARTGHAANRIASAAKSIGLDAATDPRIILAAAALTRAAAKAFEATLSSCPCLRMTKAVQNPAVSPPIKEQGPIIR